MNQNQKQKLLDFLYKEVDINSLYDLAKLCDDCCADMQISYISADSFNRKFIITRFFFNEEKINDLKYEGELL